MTNRTYRYYRGTPLYPFGFGLSYADMRLSDLSADYRTASVTVTNLSNFAAEEVVELYIKDELSSDVPVNPVLCGFTRVRLEAKESRRINLAMDSLMKEQKNLQEKNALQ